MIHIHDVPDEVRQAAYRALDLVERTAKVAHIRFDSVLEGTPGVSEQPRLLRFDAAGQEVEMTVAARDDGLLAVDIALRPPLEAPLEVRHVDSTGATTVQRGQGPFAVAPGLVTVVVHRPDEGGGPLATAWVRL